MDGIISLPIAIAGAFMLPDLPETTRAFYLSTEDRILARKRMDDIGRAPRSRLGWSAWKRVFGRWHVYVLCVLYVIFINTGPSSSLNPLALWMKANGWSVYNIVSVLFVSILEWGRVLMVELERHTYWTIRCSACVNCQSGYA